MKETENMESSKKIFPEKIVGKWKVLNEWVLNEKKEIKWLCHCECGTERYVLERSLKYGGSKSCGCIARKNARETVSHKLEGMIFGELKVLQISKKQRKNGGIWWTCQCTCGNLYDVPGTLLVKGNRTHCNSRKHGKNYAFIDITGKRFGYLTALYPTQKRDIRGSVIWHCYCDCGNKVDVSYNTLVYTNLQSCGCQKKKHNEKLRFFLTHVDGTSLDAIRSKKIPTDNTSGMKGVYFIKGKWVAKIVFQKKQFYLGKYDNKEEAVQTRREAERILFQSVVSYYEQWSARAATDSDWAVENPVNIIVSKENGNRLRVSFTPTILEIKEKMIDDTENRSANTLQSERGGCSAGENKKL